MTSMRVGLRATLALLGGLSAGCGYSSARPFPSGIESVYVEMFQSQEFRRDLEFQLTEALVKRIEMDTPYRIARQTEADTIISGEILEVRQNVLGKEFRTNLPREMGVVIAIRYRWKDQRNGDILVDRPRFVHMDSYIQPVGETFTTGVSVRGLDRMAERIVESMETEW